MKRIGSINGVKLYDLIKSRDNVEKAIKLACRDHAHDPAVKQIREGPEQYIDAICEILENKSFHYSKFKNKTIYERGKQRHLLFTRTFPDRIIQHAIFNIVAPILHGTVIKDEYQAIKGRGTHSCSMQIRKDVQSDWQHTWYCLKLDVRKFFDNVDRHILYDMVKNKIKDRDTLDILHTIIFDVPGKKGLPIGLFSSQILSVFYLTGLDHYCKETLGVRYYYRYMDDIVILASNKVLLHNYQRYIERYLNVLHLSLKNNHQIFPIEKRRLDFVGFVFNHREVSIRKRTATMYKKQCNNIIRCLKNHIPLTISMFLSVNQYQGIIHWASTDALYNKYTNMVNIALEFGVDAI